VATAKGTKVRKMASALTTDADEKLWTRAPVHPVQ